MALTSLVLAVAGKSFTAPAGDSINLGGYSVTGVYALDILNGTSGGISGLEVSAVTYARDRNNGLGSLFVVGDEGTGVLVMTEERLQDAYKFTYVNGGTAVLANSFVSMSNTNVGNSGIEGISYDPRNGGFVTVKQESPQNIYAGSLTFGAATGGPPATLTKDGTSPKGGGTSTMTQLFDPALMGLLTLSDVQTPSPITALAGSAAENNLLVLSLGSRRLIEVDRPGARA